MTGLGGSTMKQRRVVVGLLSAFAVVPPLSLSAAELPTVLTCTVNAHADRDFGFIEKAWMGALPDPGKAPDASRPFRMATKENPGTAILREKVFSGLDTPHPTIKSITPGNALGLPAEAVEFRGTVVSRFGETVFVVWDNETPNPNKVWLAAVNRAEGKVAMSQVLQGATSVGVEVETLDCE
jgi:hypothetical protein